MTKYKYKKARRVVPWVEVTCMGCGCTVGLDYKNAKTVGAIKKATSEWRYCGEHGNLCPDCYYNYLHDKTTV